MPCQGSGRNTLPSPPASPPVSCGCCSVTKPQKSRGRGAGSLRQAATGAQLPGGRAEQRIDGKRRGLLESHPQDIKDDACVRFLGPGEHIPSNGVAGNSRGLWKSNARSLKPRRPCARAVPSASRASVAPGVPFLGLWLRHSHLCLCFPWPALLCLCILSSVSYKDTCPCNLGPPKWSSQVSSRPSSMSPIHGS